MVVQSYLEINQSQKSIIFVVPESLSKHYKNDFWRTGQARTVQKKARPDKTRQDEAKEGPAKIGQRSVKGGGVFPTLKGGTAGVYPA